MRNLPLSKVYQLLEPGPVVLLSTARNGVPNVMTMSWHTMLDFEPPLIGVVVSDRNFSFATLSSTKECVIGIPSEKLAKQVVGCGNTSGRNADKFSKYHLTPLRASRVKAPLVKECFVNIECKVADSTMARRYNFFVLKAIKAWVTPNRRTPKTLHHMGLGKFMVAGRIIRLPSKMK